MATESGGDNNNISDYRSLHPNIYDAGFNLGVMKYEKCKPALCGFESKKYATFEQRTAFIEGFQAGYQDSENNDATINPIPNTEIE